MLIQSSTITTDAAKFDEPRLLRCVSWSAVSSEKQSESDKESLPEQRGQNAIFVAELGRHYPGFAGALVAELEVVGSRSIIRLEDACTIFPAYAELRSLLACRAIDAIILRETSRLGRNRALVTTIEELAREAGCVVIPRYGARPSLDGNGDGDALISAIQSTLAQQEVAQLMRRKEMGMKGRIKNKRLFASQAPYGYRNVRDPNTGKVVSIEVVPEQAAVVRLILLELYLEREMGEPAIAKELNRLGFRTPSQYKADAGDGHVPSEEWSVPSVHQILTRLEAYGGYVYWNRKAGQPYRASSGQRKTPQRKAIVTEKGRHEGIITEDEMARLLTERAERTYTRRTRLWSGTAVCATCNTLMVGNQMVYTKQGQRVVADCMLCKDCGQRITDAALMEAVLTSVTALERGMDEKAVATLATATPARPSRAANEVASLERRLADYDAQRKRLVDGWQAGRITDEEYDSRIDAVAKERARTVAELERLGAEQEEVAAVGKRDDRMKEVRTAARAIMAEAGENPDLVRKWLKRHVRAVVFPRGDAKSRGAKRVAVEWL